MADKVDKSTKRKRHGQGSSKPSKKVAIEEDRIIKISQQDPDKWAPIIGKHSVDTYDQSQKGSVDWFHRSDHVLT